MNPKRWGFLILVLGVLGWTASSLVRRAREESHERVVTLAVDWSEFRDFWARQPLDSAHLLAQLRGTGASGAVVSPLTLSELLLEHRVQPVGPVWGDPLDTMRLRFTDSALAQQVMHELMARGTTDLQLMREGTTSLLIRKTGRFAALKDIDLGYDEALLQQIRQSGLVPILRVLQDPWSLSTAPEASSMAHCLLQSPIGLYWGADDLPGGVDSLALWKSALAHTGATQFLFEFKPAKAALLMAQALPASTYKAHTIPVAEFKDSTWEQQKLRWIRAVDERMCRLLLLHVPPAVSGPQFMDQLRELSQILNRRGFQLGFPSPRSYWPSTIGRAQRCVSPLLAFGFAVLAPLAGLWWSVSNVVKAKMPVVHRWPMPVRQFVKLSVLTLLGAFVVAAVAGNPYTRLEIVPFRGIKLIFILSMAGALSMLYPWEELARLGRQAVSRWDIVLGLFLAAAGGYLLLRTGNAPAAARSSLEQPVREFLERVFIARPRFKEFAIGHPLMILGFYVQTWFRQKQWPWDGRSLVWAGMIGQVSMVNTFCHLHCPLRMELWRSVNGLLLGLVVGMIYVVVAKRFTKKVLSQ